MNDEALEALREANGLDAKPALSERELGRLEGLAAAVTILDAAGVNASALVSITGRRVFDELLRKLDEKK